MSDKQVKLLRKQIRNVVQEILPGVLTQEMRNSIYEQLNSTLSTQLKQISDHVKSTLDAIDQRAKDLQSYAVRQSGVVAPPISPTIEEPKSQ